MTFTQSMARMCPAHFDNVLREMRRIELSNLPAAEKAIQIRLAFHCGAKEWLLHGFENVQHFMDDNTNSRLDFAVLAIGSTCEFKGEAEWPKRSDWYKKKFQKAV